MDNTTLTKIPTNNPENRKTKILIALSIFFACASIVFISLFAWRSCSSTPTFKVAINSMTLAIDKLEAKKGEDFNATISIKPGVEHKKLPLNMTSVKCADKDIPWAFSADSGTFYIAAKDITGNITITGEAIDALHL